MQRILGLALSTSLLACTSIGDGGDSPSGADAGTGAGGFADSGTGGGTNPVDADGDAVADDTDNCPALANADQADGDGDTYGDACDCDPASPDVAAYLVVEAPLTSDQGYFSTPPDFLADSWSYAAAGYLQNRLVNNGHDSVLFTGEPLTDVLVTATVSSTEIADFDATDLRQLLLFARGEAKEGSFGMIACGLEVDETQTPTQKTSVLTLSGAPSNPAITINDRVDRSPIQVDEEAQVVMELRGDTMTCTVTLPGGEVTTASASGLAVRPGALGLYTRETKALFKNLRICTY